MRNQRLIKTYQRSFFVDWIYGIHAIQTMLKSAPQRVAEIHVQSGRRDDRLQKIYNLAEQHGILLQPVTSKKLDACLEP